ncbi:RelA/SpoT domain-containing protein [Granulosicoccus antarcticus]|uniref:GTP pyrophosphokinase YwaC n=1 Tax=Granulosicoccus antarcticus IMCC3135 TaxID=1192854 RepID=A0A2Z2NY59_9GAMM|nr:RelA/SpoT domain-containing protein [Granulosicoccus antarcticus]ASJ76229.1 GTP pyrophosphokinase YwaC [Granulosicoccus antarcticus IMCC3135]
MSNTAYSGNQINKAGNKLAETDADLADISTAMDVLSYWRHCHEKPLEAAFVPLQRVTKEIDRDAIFARRLKRTASIVSKLQRSQGRMQLNRMQDIGGCRAIISTEKKLRKIVRELKKSPEFRASESVIRVMDYIESPKEDGYRSVHLVGKFPDGTGLSRSIEIQVRTRIQHYWATAVEIVDLFTGQALKSNQGDPEWKDFFASVSRQFALMESVHIFSQLEYQRQFDSYMKIIQDDDELLIDCLETQRLSKSVDAAGKLEAFFNSLKIIDDRLSELPGSGYVLLKIDTINRSVSAVMYRYQDSAAAEKAYIALEKQTIDNPRTVVALVSSAAVGGIKAAYPNYFANSTEFLKLLNIVENVRNPRQRGLFQRLIGV